MAEISDAEVRRLLSYLKHHVGDEDLAEIESELRKIKRCIRSNREIFS